MIKGISHFIASEDATTSIEYGIIAFEVVMAVVFALPPVGKWISKIFNILARTLRALGKAI